MFYESALCFVWVHVMSEVCVSGVGLLNDVGCVLLLGMTLWAVVRIRCRGLGCRFLVERVVVGLVRGRSTPVLFGLTQKVFN